MAIKTILGVGVLGYALLTANSWGQAIADTRAKDVATITSEIELTHPDATKVAIGNGNVATFEDNGATCRVFLEHRYDGPNDPTYSLGLATTENNSLAVPVCF